MKAIQLLFFNHNSYNSRSTGPPRHLHYSWPCTLLNFFNALYSCTIRNFANTAGKFIHIRTNLEVRRTTSTHSPPAFSHENIISIRFNSQILNITERRQVVQLELELPLWLDSQKERTVRRVPLQGQIGN